MSTQTLERNPIHTMEVEASIGRDQSVASSMNKPRTWSLLHLVIGVVAAFALGALLGGIATYYVADSQRSSSAAPATTQPEDLTADPEAEVAPDGYNETLFLTSLALAVTDTNCTVVVPSGGTCASGPTTAYTTNQKGLDLIKSFEGFYSRFYIDPVGIKTIGYGYACHVNSCSGGIFAKGYITPAEGEQLLIQELATHEKCVKDYVKVNLNLNQFSALASFSYNAGCGALSRSTLLKLLNGGDYASVPAQLNRFVYGGGKVLPGLVRRRKAEGDLFTDTVCTGTAVKNIPGICKVDTLCAGSTASGLCAGPSNVKCCFNEPQVSDSCLVSGTAGRCMEVSKCVGTPYSGRCPGPSSIQCCIPAASDASAGIDVDCTATDGRKGTCQDVSTCDGDSITGLCAGSASNQCCVPFKSCTITDGRQGVCRPTTSCASPRQAVAGFCPGSASSVQCCVPPIAQKSTNVSCVSNGQQGVCKDKATCAGTSVSGLCPGAANIQCCLASSPAAPSCQVGSNKGVCIDVDSCAGLSTKGLCSGAANIQCCTSVTPNPLCDSLGAETEFDAYADGKFLGPIITVKLQNKNVEKNTACAFLIMNKAYSTANPGKSIVINSGFRTMEEQRYFFNCYQTQSCNNGNLAARPGYSNHQNGIALDLGVSASGVYTWLAANAQKYGFVRTVPSENWHWEYRPGAPKASYT